MGRSSVKPRRGAQVDFPDGYPGTQSAASALHGTLVAAEGSKGSKALLTQG